MDLRSIVGDFDTGRLQDVIDLVTGPLGEHGEGRS